MLKILATYSKCENEPAQPYQQFSKVKTLDSPSGEARGNGSDLVFKNKTVAIRILSLII